MKYSAINPRLLLTTFIVLVLVASVAQGATGGDARLPSDSVIQRSDDSGLSVHLRFDPPAEARGRDLHLDGCSMESRGEDPRDSGAPMLPVWRGLLALPPGQVAELSWRLVDRQALAGRPLPFPTATATPQGDETLYGEELVEDPAAFARSYPLQVRLGEVRRLRDQRTVELIVEPMSWDPESGLALAREIRVDVRFRPEAAARSAAALREPARRPEKHWDRVYAGTLLNSGQARDWKRRVPRTMMADRAERATAALELFTADDGLYAVRGDSLAAHGIALGSPLSSIALYRQRFDWDPLEQPRFEQTAEGRYFVDRDGDDLLDADDLMVFPGRRLRHAVESPDSVEWFSRAAAHYVALDAALALEMATEPGWDAAGSWPQRSSFTRHFWEQGENHFFNTPPNWYYNGLSAENWDDNLYFWRPPHSSTGFVLNLPVSTPGYMAGTPADLAMYFQGSATTNLDPTRDFQVSVENSGGGCTLPGFSISYLDTIRFESALAPGCLVDGENTLVVDRTDGGEWRALLKWYELEYSSAYVARDDSLLFHADGAVGNAEIRVGGLTTDRETWHLLRMSNGTPTRVTLTQDSEGGAPGNRELRLRRALTGDESWLLADEAALLAPEIGEPEEIAFLDDLSPADVLVIAHGEFTDGMQRWIDYRADQGYQVKMLDVEQVWDAFFGGAKGARAIRHAARFAYQQWGAEALLLVGDANKDARELHDDISGWDPDPNFVPLYSEHDYVGVHELVGLEEWVVKWEWNDWPAMLMGRLPVGNTDELTIILDKIECMESTATEGECAADADWRKRFLLVADDCWVWDDWNVPCYCGGSEQGFEPGQESIGAVIDGSWVGDLEYVPFNLSELTDQWYEDNSPVLPTTMAELLPVLVEPVFAASLSQGYLLAAVQSHANRGQVCHEMILKTSGGSHDVDDLTNVNMPFFWMLFGCHGNTFSYFKEGKTFVEDCIGENLLFADENRGAVASYASEGFEYLNPNLHWERDWIEVMTSGVDPDQALDILPEWRIGELQMVAELRFGTYDASFRTHILGDPLLRLDAGPPRLRLFVNEEEVTQDDLMPAQNPGDTLRVEALIHDETYLASIRLHDPVLGEFPHELTPMFSDETTFPLDSLEAMDEDAFAQDGRARAWHLSARVPYDFAMEALILEGRDLADRSATFVLESPKKVDFFMEGGDSLRWGQWVRPAGEMRILVTVPSTEIPPTAFSLLVDGIPSGVSAETTDVDNIYLMVLPYSWDAGEHTLAVRFEGQDYGVIMLRVDGSTRLLDGLVFPNPFRDVVGFQFELTNAVSEGSLSIYTLSGRRIYRRELAGMIEGPQEPIIWDGLDQTGSKIANGVYIARLVLNDAEGVNVVWEDKVVRMR